jgi:hypothetical protein
MKIGSKDAESCIDESFCLVSCDILIYDGGFQPFNIGCVKKIEKTKMNIVLHR